MWSIDSVSTHVHTVSQFAYTINFVAISWFVDIFDTRHDISNDDRKHRHLKKISSNKLNHLCCSPFSVALQPGHNSFFDIRMVYNLLSIDTSTVIVTKILIPPPPQFKNSQRVKLLRSYPIEINITEETRSFEGLNNPFGIYNIHFSPITYSTMQRIWSVLGNWIELGPSKSHHSVLILSGF